ncbi:integral membrane protein [Anaeramoeba ignava]|uniref:Integral membrane protein n=1 Tax=Anaeramoeba ignava TaxID=1746090 RepID=A0A9Q0LP39_ANAIG|nr:integral membrane protein [Anaeramoeba ignava]
MKLSDVVDTVAPSAIGLKCVSLGIFAMIYLTVAIFAAFVLYQDLSVKIKVSKLRTKYQAAILSLAFGLMFIRFILLFFHIHWKSLFNLLFWCYVIPLTFQFATFSLLVVFLLIMVFAVLRKIILQKRVFTLYIIANIIVFILLIIAVAFQMNLPLNDFDNRTSTYVAISYILLIIVFVAARFKIFSHLKMAHFPNDIKKSVHNFLILTTIYSVIYFIRSIMGFVSLISKNSSFFKIFDLVSEHKIEVRYTLYGIFMLIFEILPTFFLIFSLFRTIKYEKSQITRKVTIQDSLLHEISDEDDIKELSDS